MKQLFTALAVVMALAIGSPTGCTTNYNVSLASQELDITQLKFEMADPTMLVLRESGGSGSGFVFGNGWYLLTAAHVIASKPNPDGSEPESPTDPVIVLKKSGPITVFSCKTEVVKVDFKLDLAVLKLASQWRSNVIISKTDPKLYEKCWIAGHPLGVTYTNITEGRVQCLNDEEYVRYSALSIFGNSGGPVFKFEDGHFQVFSICQKVYTTGDRNAVTHMGLGVMPFQLRAFVKDYE